MKIVYVARLIGSRGRVWVAFDRVDTVTGTTDLSKREVLERFAAMHGAYTAVAEIKGAMRPAQLGATMASVRLEGD
jgi:DUF1365 family protein